MREFFHGWRRKAGCVALVMACALTGVWMRSLTLDEFVLKDATGFQSTQGKMEWFKVTQLDGEQIRRPLQWYSQQHFFDDGMQMAPTETNWVRKWSGFEFSGRYILDHSGTPTTLTTTWIIPYWSVVVPLTLLSAYLILWKPRKRVPATPTN